MPAGVTWGFYLKHSCAALFAMLVGAQVVHAIYQPLKDIDRLVEQEVERLRKEAANSGEERELLDDS